MVDLTTDNHIKLLQIKSDSALLRVEEIDFEIPPGTQKGVINTIEGYLRTAAKNLGDNILFVALYESLLLFYNRLDLLNII